MRRALRVLFRLVLFGALFAIGAWAGVLSAAIPKLDELESRADVRELKGAIVARDGRTELRELRAPETRTYLEEGDIPRVLRNAVIAAEDRRFGSHSGIDLRGIARAVVSDVRARSAVEGGSTITQQLVKNTYVGPKQTLGRKSREAVFAVALETRWSKDRILTTYLNTAYFGSGYYGVADAAQGYFGVPVTGLRVDQAALLGALLRAPEGNSPLTAPNNARAGRNRVLGAMADLGSISRPASTVAQARPLPSVRARARRSGGKELAPQLADTVTAQLIERYGVRRALGGGLRVKTTIDARQQRAANRALARVEALGLDAALVAIDPATGEVRAMANGGTARRAAFNVALDGQRQPGSAFKPFMLAAAYERGYAPGTTIRSAPFDVTYEGIGRFRVTNGGGYSGVTRLDRATWQSDNTVYARLQDQVGIEAAIEAAQAAGIRSQMDPVPALVLGALPQGTTPTELAHAYATLAAHGKRTSLVEGGGPRIISVVGEGKGRTWRPLAVRRSTIDAGVADEVTETLQGVVRTGTGTGTGAAIGRPVAGKTGTTEDYRDAWFVGYTPDLVTAVWVGHARGGVPMRTENGGGPVTGGSIPAAIWASFMRAALEGTPTREFTLSHPEYVTVSIDPDSGLLAGPWCEGAVDAQFVAGREPTETATDCIARQRPVPDLLGLTLADAKQALDDEDFDVRVTTEERLVQDPDQHERVVAQLPRAGTLVDRTAAVTLAIGDDPFAE
ncbi:MAG: penicillin-binding protein [Thermoleophilia bacterium]|nr:penicillin-binding protein [Thermoleophilia bacterium]